MILRVMMRQFACVDGYRPQLWWRRGDDGLVRLDGGLLGSDDGLSPLSSNARAMRAVYEVTRVASFA